MADVQYLGVASVTYDVSFLARGKLSKVNSETTIFILIIHLQFSSWSRMPFLNDHIVGIIKCGIKKCGFLMKIGIEQEVLLCDWISAFSKGVHSNMDDL